MRKPIQITTTGKGALIALCDDGSMFRMTSQGWDQLDSIPQPEKTKAVTVKRFKAPTVSEVADYCAERCNHVDAGAFVDHYSANGWKRGSTPIKDWKACVRTWEKNTTSKIQPTLPAGIARLKELAR
ncbi:MAG: hypothetical protein HOE44_05190 [Candidatus Marinimicrobia bacterium]|nr:hypothetical protein [Candidatus Neomarinimicrobiota bacterium]